ncbi:MAG: trimeric autotransporter adhesin [Gaiellaceae bacterium]|nr:trimeric autotransporter adhesin [Gaiellaceae bacterium]
MRTILVALVALVALLGGANGASASRTSGAEDCSISVYVDAPTAIGSTGAMLNAHGKADPICHAFLSFTITDANGVGVGETGKIPILEGKFQVPATGLRPATRYTAAAHVTGVFYGYPYEGRAGELPFETVSSLTVTSTGAGLISSTPAGIACGTTCTLDYPTGTVLTLAEVPSPGWLFGGWGTDSCGNGPSCIVAVNGAAVVRPTFVRGAILTVAKAGTGSGSVSGGGLACGGACTATFARGAVVSLTATPEPGSRFDGWSGAWSGAAAACTPELGGDATATATFTKLAGLRIRRHGAGTVTSAPRGIACGALCFGNFADGVPLTLKAKPKAGFKFAGWGGACHGKALMCTVTPAGLTTANATFKAKPKARPVK